MSDNGAKYRQTNNGGQQQQQPTEQSSGSRLQKHSNISDMSDWAKTDEFSKRKNLRLQQVREQSKQIASQLRNRVRDEKERQLQVANAIKQNEMLNWQQRQIEQTAKEYKVSLTKVGEAHLAAQAENARMKAIDEQKLKNRQLALRRGKIASEQLAKSKSLSNRGPANVEKVNKKQVTVATQVNDSVNSSNISSSSSSSISSSTSSSLVDFSNGKSSRTLADRLQTEYLPKSSMQLSSDDELDTGILTAAMPKKKISVTYNVPLTESQDNGNADHTKRKRDVTPTSILKGPRKLVDMNGNDSSDASLLKPVDVPTITRVTDLLKKSHELDGIEPDPALPKSSLHRKSSISQQSLFSAPPKPIIVNKKVNDKAGSPQSILKRSRAKSISPKPQPKPILKKSTMKIQKTPKKSSVKQLTAIEKRQQTPFHYVPRFVTDTQKQDAPTMAAPVQRQRVQFYDHANRFGKEYEINSPFIQQHEQNTATLNAMDEAKKEVELEQKRLTELMHARKIEEIRAKQAFEKEKIRRDYDLMTAQLEALTQQENYARIQSESDELFSETRIQQAAEEKQRLMNLEFQRVLHEPVLITCKKVSSKQSAANASETSSSELNVASDASKNVTAATNDIRTIVGPRTMGSELSTDNCSSFLLDYVNSRSEDILRDIGNLKQGASDASGNNAAALKDLLGKVDGLKDLLHEAIRTHQGSNSEQLKKDMKYVLNELVDVDREETKLKSDKTRGDKKVRSVDNKETSNTSNQLTLREKMLKFKEQCLEDKLKELYLQEKKLQRDVEQLKGARKKQGTISHATANIEDSVASGSTNGDVPVRIVINVNQKHRNKTTKSEMKWAELLQNPIDVADKSKSVAVLAKVTDKPGASFPKTPTRVTKKVVTNVEQISSTSTTLTAYLSPPEEINTVLTQALKNGQQNRPIATSQNVVGVENNPQVAHYIARLLAMSRDSVDQLGISSVSTVATPSSSIMETADNAVSRRALTASSSQSGITDSPPEPLKRPTIDAQKMEQLRKFIIDNQNLVEELNNSLKSTSQVGQNRTIGLRNEDESRKVENIWSELLKNKSAERTNAKTAANELPENTENDQAETNQPQKTDLITKYDELTAHCAKRITDLNSMISKVRGEKQKLLENTLSSAGSLISGQVHKENVTEYMDFVQQPENENNAHITDIEGDTSQGSDVKSLQTQSPEYSSGAATVAGIITNAPPMMHSKQMGVSKDSGVGISRPVTASDFRDSPEFKTADHQQQLCEANGSAAQQKATETWEPLLKDIPKVNYRLNDPANSEIPSQTIALRPDMHSTNWDNTSKKHPPAMLTRYSPQLDDNHAHELSTITEVDTPATSRINTTVAQQDISQGTNDLPQRTKRSEIIGLFYNRFPAFSEYARANNLDMSVDSSGSMLNITAAASLLLGDNLDKVLDIDAGQVDALKYRSLHQSMKSLSIDEGATSLDYNKFPTHREYARSEPGLLDSRSLEGLLSMEVDTAVGLSRTSNRDECNDSSLMDIVGEMRRRNMLREALALGASSASTQNQNASSMSSSIDELVAELQNVGINWASSMLKKSIETNALSSSSSSSSKSHDKSQNRKRVISKTETPAMNETADNIKATTSNSFVDPNLTAIEIAKRGALATAAIPEEPKLDTSESRPVNLKEFLARELMKHSSTSSMSSSSIDSSMVSIYLKSLNSSNPSTPAANGQTLDKQRTSTPVHDSALLTRVSSAAARKASSPDAIEPTGDLTEKLFSGESRLSSVRNHSSDTDITFERETSIDEAQRHRNFEALSIPANLHLNLAQQRPGSSDSS